MIFNLEKVWNFLDGKKTTFGAVIFLLATVAQQVGWVTNVGAINKIAEVVVAIGLGHKVIKR